MLADLLYRLQALFRGQQMDSEVDEELRGHLEYEADKFRRLGLPPDQAMRRARLALGGPEQVKQQVRESRGTKLLEELLQDLRCAVRSFAKTPGTTALILLSLAIGIGANTAVFSFTSALLLNPLPYPNPDRLTILWLRSPGIGILQDWPSPGQYHDILSQNRVFDDSALVTGSSFILTDREKAIKVGGMEATSSLLPMLGAKPMLGRLFLPEEDRPGAPQTVVLTYGLWQQAFASDSHILGQNVTLNGHLHTVVGVLPASFRLDHEVIPTVGGISKPEFFMPPSDEARDATNYGSENFNILARLKPGVSVKQAQADIDVIAARIRKDKARDPSFTISVVSLMDQVVGDIRTAMLIIFGAVASVLLIACTNVANLLLSRATARQREIAVRAALGAGRARVVRQLLTETVLLSLIGGIAGTGLSAVCILLARKMHPANIPRLDELGLDWRVLAFTFAISLTTGVLFGLAPALRAARVNLTASLKSGGRGSLQGGLSLRGDRLRGTLVIAELAISLPLLVAAGLLVRSFTRLSDVPPGFNPQHVISINISAYGPTLNTPAKRIQFYQELTDRTNHLPGVTAAGAVSALPLTPSVGWGKIHIEGYTPPPNEPEVQADFRVATPSYFNAMQVPLILGRPFADTDTQAMPPVAIIDRKMADRFWPHSDAVGKHVRRSDDDAWATVVGVVGVVKEYGLDAGTRMVMYFPHAQLPAGTMYFVARTQTDPDAFSNQISRLANSINPNVPVSDVATMSQRLRDSLARQRFAMFMVSGFAAFALLLAAIGVYGVISFLVTQGTADIALRMALGARRLSILSWVFKQGAKLAAVGLVAGVMGALALTRINEQSAFRGEGL